MKKNEWIRDLREDSGLTQTYLANLLHISQRTYSRYENAERMIPPEILSQLADFYNTSVDYLLERTSTKSRY